MCVGMCVQVVGCGGCFALPGFKYVRCGMIACRDLWYSTIGGFGWKPLLNGLRLGLDHVIGLFYQGLLLRYPQYALGRVGISEEIWCGQSFLL